MISIRRGFKAIVCIIGLMGIPGGALAEETTLPLTEAQDIFAAGNAFYQEQKYDEARLAYQELLDAGYEVPEVLYNLGTAEARVGNGTLAVANLTRAKTLDPRNQDIRANLTYMKSAGPALPGRPVAEQQTADSIWQRVYGWLTAEEWLMMCWVGLMILAAGLSVSMLTMKRTWVSAGRGLAMVGMMVTAMLAVPTIAQVYATKIRKLAMVVERADMLSGPAPRFTRISSLAEGETLRLLRHESGGYVRVQAPDGVTGYVAREALRRI